MAAQVKLIHLTDKPWENRWAALIDAVRKNFGAELTATIKTTSLETLASDFQEVLRGDYDICRVSDSLSVEILKHLPQTTAETNHVGACGFLLKEKQMWWPRPLLAEAFTRCLSQDIHKLDLSSSALVAGASGSGKMIISSLVKQGFMKINLADRIETTGREMIAEMKKKYFQVAFEYIPFETITTLPGVHSLIVNTTPLVLENELLDELYFFNFLKTGGIVVDLTLLPPETPLLSEAKQWGARHLSGDYVVAHRDILMMESAKLGRLPFEEYRLALRSLAEAVPFDPGPFLKRFRDRV